MAKVTFALDDDTVALIRRLAERQQKPQSHVVREAVAVYAAEGARLDAHERLRKLRVLDAIKARPHRRTAAQVDRELRTLRQARRTGWRRPSD
jgi:hypothetical protein